MEISKIFSILDWGKGGLQYRLVLSIDCSELNRFPLKYLLRTIAIDLFREIRKSLFVITRFSFKQIRLKTAAAAVAAAKEKKR